MIGRRNIYYYEKITVIFIFLCIIYIFDQLITVLIESVDISTDSQNVFEKYICVQLC